MRPCWLIGMIALILMPRAVAQLPEATTYTLPRLNALPKAKVVRTIDGDTIDLKIGGKIESCRLIGIDTPELKGDAEKTFYGREAAWYTFNLLAGESVWYEADPKMARDTFGRLLVFVYRAPDGLFVNLELIRLGYARVYEYEHARAGLFKGYEARAREAKKGLWNPTLKNETSKAAANSNAQTAAPRQTVSASTGAAAASPGNDADTVYVTKSGKKYHRAGCRSLSKSSIPISLATAKARRLQPCSVCKP
ncbi:thermonuclease family protein [bacterium]|nr:thermonuclease family protein [bacterium]